MTRFRKSLKETVAFMVWVVLFVACVVAFVNALMHESWVYGVLSFVSLFMGILYMNWYHSK